MLKGEGEGGENERMNFRNRASWIGELVVPWAVSITFETGLLFLHHTDCELKEPSEQGTILILSTRKI